MLNVKMDTWAKAKLAETNGREPMDIPFKGWACYIESKKMVKQWSLKLWEHINGAKILQHWNQKDE